MANECAGSNAAQKDILMSNEHAQFAGHSSLGAAQCPEGQTAPRVGVRVRFAAV
jgi:hypothetical protein